VRRKKTAERDATRAKFVEEIGGEKEIREKKRDKKKK